MRIPNSRLHTWLVTVWLVLSIGGVVVSLLVWQELNRSLDATTRAMAFSVTLQDVRSTLDQAAAAEQAYLRSGDPAQLARFAAARQRFPGQFEKLVDQLMDDAAMRDQAFSLRSAADLRLEQLQHVMDVRRLSGVKAAQQAAQAAEARGFSEQIQAAINRLQSWPDSLFSQTGSRTRSDLWRAFVATLVAGFVGLGAGAFALYFSRLAVYRQESEQSMAEQALRAERAAQEKSEFLANMSHEIRTPMNAVLGFSELLAAELPRGSKADRYAQSIRASAFSLLQLINDVLDLSKVEAGMIEIRLEPTDVRELTNFFTTVFGQQVQRKGIALHISVPPELPTALLLDRSRVRQLLVNLVGNAIKFTERGSVTLAVRWEPAAAARSRGALVFEVADTGVGIPPADQAEIFRPFAQVDAMRATEQQGTGLGLAIVKRLAERMGGSITVQSTVGVGSTFRFRLPDVAVSARLPAEDRLETDEQADFNRLAPATVLVVDDNAVNRDLLAGLFDGTHHQLRFARNGREAVDLVRAARPDLVLMDVRMPRMDGVTAVGEIHRIEGADLLPIIAVTASSLVEDEHRIRGLFSGYVRKPFTRQDLYREMAQFLPRQRNGRAGPGADAAAPATGDNPAQWPAMVASLRELEPAWRAVCDSGAVGETRDFGLRLREVAQKAGCTPLLAYADALLAEAASYAVVKLEARLNEFPELVRTLARRSESPADTAPSQA